MQIMFLCRGLLKIPAYLSACPPSKVGRRDRIGVAFPLTTDTAKRFSLPVHLVAESAGRAGNARPCGPLFPNENPSDFLSDLPAPRRKVYTGPTADAARRLKVGQRLKGFKDQRFAGPGGQRDRF